MQPCARHTPLTTVLSHAQTRAYHRNAGFEPVTKDTWERHLAPSPWFQERFGAREHARWERDGGAAATSLRPWTRVVCAPFALVRARCPPGAPSHCNTVVTATHPSD